MRCRVCGTDCSNEKAITRYLNRASQYYSCPQCHCLFLFPLPDTPDNQAFEAEQAVEEIAERDEERSIYFDARLNWLESAIGESIPGCRLLEIGCGSGQFLTKAQKRSWKVEGAELSPLLTLKARQNNPGVTVRTGDFVSLEGLVPAAYDVIVALDVLEHVFDPIALIRRGASLLRPGGVLLLQTPNADSLRRRMQGQRWNMLIPQYHYHLFSPSGLDRLLRQEGFKILRIRTASGSGQEKGMARLISRLKEGLLSAFRLGNALVVVAKSRG